MTYTIFVDDLATRVSTTLEHAKDIAEPYVGLGRKVAIRRFDDESHPESWHYDFGRYEWVVLDRPAQIVELNQSYGMRCRKRGAAKR